MALRFEDVDFDAGLLRVERAWDPHAGSFVAPKSKAGTRRVPIPAVLRSYLLEHRLRSGRAGGLVFGDGTQQFDYWRAFKLDKRAWKGGGLAPIGMHEARHAFASVMIAAA